MSRPIYFILIAAILWFAPVHFAEAQTGQPWPDDCKLQRQATLPFSLENGHIVLAVTLNDVPRRFLVDTGGFLSSVTQAVAAEQKLSSLPIRDDLKILGIGGGKPTERYAIADTLVFGKLRAENVHLLIVPSLGTGLDGIIGPDYLRNFDIEIDFESKTINFFKPHHCPGHAVYWSGASVTLLMKLSDQGHIRVLATLDDRDLETLVDTGSPASLIGARTMATKFNMPDASGTIALHGASGGTTTASAHRFGKLVLGGLTIQNPPLLITADESAWGSDDTSLLLGLRELSMFHVYIAYRAKEMYLTPRQPDRDAAAGK